MYPYYFLHFWLHIMGRSYAHKGFPVTIWNYSFVSSSMYLSLFPWAPSSFLSSDHSILVVYLGYHWCEVGVSPGVHILRFSSSSSQNCHVIDLESLCIVFRHFPTFRTVWHCWFYYGFVDASRLSAKLDGLHLFALCLDCVIYFSTIVQAAAKFTYPI